MQRTAAWRISVLSLQVSLAVSPLAAQAEAHTMAHAHMSFSPAQPASPADTARALAFLETLRNSLAPYQTLEAAEAAGYVPARSPESVKEGKLLHAGRRPRRPRSQGRFDPANPQALLFEKDARGIMKLSGAMFVAPPAASLADLDAMIPLGVARWHQHTNVCVAADRTQSRRIVKATTEQECTRLGGRFRAQSRFMVHVMTGVGNDLALAFPQRPDPDDDMMSGHSMAPPMR